MRASTFQQKVEWLLEHPGLWEDIPGLGCVLNPKLRPKMIQLVYEVRKAGLYSKKTGTVDVEFSLRQVCVEARRVRRVRRTTT